MSETRVLHMASPTHYANSMIRYMVANKLLDGIPALQISGISMDYWNVDYPTIPARQDDRICRIDSEQHMAFDQLRYFSNAGIYSRFEWRGYGQRMENFPSKTVCRDLFRAEQSIGMVTSEDVVVCPVRGGEILGAIHPGYTTVPVDFYSDLIGETRLEPVFMGQLDDNSYVSALRKRFPKARFVPHMGALEDFQTIRKAKNIILPVSTFAWLAAWLSEARTIILPVFGMYNPNLFPLHDLLPIGEASYRFFRFPEQQAVPLAEMAAAHARISGAWSEVSSDSLAPGRVYLAS